MKNQYVATMMLVIFLLTGSLSAQNFSLRMDGVDSKVGILDSPELNPTDALTIEAWVNAEDWQSSIWAGVIISKQGTNPDKGYCLSGGENGRIEFTVSVDGGWKSVSTPPLLGTNAWYHVAGVYTGSQLLMYINGVLQSTAIVSGTATPGTGVVVNIAENPTWPGRYWIGKLDEIRVWNIARTQTELQENMGIELAGTEAGLVAYYPMNEGAGMTTADASGNGNTGQLINMTEMDWVDGFQPVTADVGVLGIASPSVIGSGFTSEEKVRIEIKNYATTPVSGFDVSYQIGSADVVTETLNVEIPPFETYIYTFSELVDLSGMTEITITGSTDLEGDNNPDNDQITETIVPTLNYMIFDQERHNYGGYGQSHTNTVFMPEDLSGYSEIFLNISLNCPTGGCDPWDQPAKLSIKKGAETFELVRYITPFGVACGDWTWDITDFRSLLTDRVDWVSYVQVWGSSGWLVSVELELVQGTPEYPFTKVDKLWTSDNWVYGDPDISDDFPEMTIQVDQVTEKAKIRMTTTGHGQGNTNNAAEFAHFTHHVYVDGMETFEQDLWKPDCNTNSCSPQSGTWQYARAGWCPGQDVQPWEWDMEGHFTPGEPVSMDYVLADYTNLNNTGYNGGSHTEPHFRCHTYFIQYSHEDIVNVEDFSTSEIEFIGFPNPTSGIFAVKSVKDEPIRKVTVYQLNGQEVLTENLQGKSTCRVDMSTFPNGIYFVKVQSDNSSVVLKTVKTE